MNLSDLSKQNAQRQDPGMVTAEISSCCPMCHVYIRKTVSKVRKLPRPLKLRYEIVHNPHEYNTYRSKDTKKIYNADGHEPNLLGKPRWWVHERSYGRALEALNGTI